MKTPALLLLLAGLGLPGSLLADSALLYRQSDAPIDARVQDLLSRMTLEEKAAQLCVYFESPGFGEKKATIGIIENGKFNPAKVPESMKGGIGEMAVYYQGTPAQTAGFRNDVQRWMRENTRLGIPVVFHAEAVHGFVGSGATSFPQAIALGSTWDPALVQKISAIAGRQARAQGIQRVFGPVLDLAQEPRWGRTEEAYSEDPFLVSQMGVAAVRGFQGPGPGFLPPYVMATAKHFVHGRPERGGNTHPSNLSERILRETFFRPFEAVVKQAHIATIMPSYNEIDGVPSNANTWLLRDVLRKEWGYTGVNISDYGAIENLYKKQGVAEDLQGAAVLAIKAGVDLNASKGESYAYLPELVRAGRVPQAQLDEAVARVLRYKFLAGLFDQPYVDVEKAGTGHDTAEERAVARTAAEEAIVLLKNEKSLLPFAATQFKTLAVIGPNADKIRVGGYSGMPVDFVTVLKGIQGRLGAEVKVTYAEGVKLTVPDVPVMNSFTRKIESPSAEDDERGIAEAVQVAQNADAVVLVLGGNEALAREASSKGVIGDTDDLELPGRQNELIDAVVKTGKPVVAVVINGRPYSFVHLSAKVPALLECWYLGEETGHAVAGVLFGDVNPSGKLPVTIARNVGQLPVYYYQKPVVVGWFNYILSDNSPLYPFGFGLSYTSFDYANVRVSKSTVAQGEGLTVSADITNTGQRAGVEVAQLYIRDEVASVTRPVKELRGFQRVALQPGETRTVTFELTSDGLALYNLEMKRVVEPGWFTVMVGGSSAETKQVRLEVR